MIRNPAPGNISLFTSFVLTILVGISLALLQAPFSKVLLFSLLFFLASFFVIMFALDTFIYRKIKLIYKIIHNYKTHKFDKKLFKFKLNDDPLKRVNEEVLSWAIDQGKEIAALKKQEEFRREFLGNVSHELKTPIFNIQGYIDTLLDGAIYDAEVNIEFLKKASRSADRLNQLVNDLLEISKLEDGRMEMESERFDICEFTKEIYDAMELRAAKRSIKLIIKEGCDKPFWVIADKKRIRQVMVNLLVNGINYGKEGGYVMLSFYDMDKNILVEVADNGEGIDQKHLPRLFERFYRVDKSRTRDSGGTGLGLAIVKHIIEAHQQTINVRSTVGQGTTFGFTLAKAK